jgi:hypothetical protein
MIDDRDLQFCFLYFYLCLKVSKEKHTGTRKEELPQAKDGTN